MRYLWFDRRVQDYSSRYSPCSIEPGRLTIRLPWSMQSHELKELSHEPQSGREAEEDLLSLWLQFSLPASIPWLDRLSWFISIEANASVLLVPSNIGRLLCQAFSWRVCFCFAKFPLPPAFLPPPFFGTLLMQKGYQTPARL